MHPFPEKKRRNIMSDSDNDLHKTPTEPSKRLRKLIEAGSATPPLTGPDALPVLPDSGSTEELPIGETLPLAEEPEQPAAPAAVAPFLPLDSEEPDVDAEDTPVHQAQVPAPSGAGDPLPQRVPETDTGATRVERVVLVPRRSRGTPRPHAVTPPPPPPPPDQPPDVPPSSSSKAPRGCFLRGLIAVFFATVIIAVIAGTVLVYQYFRIASSLPSVEDLRSRASQFETTRIYDRDGNVIYEIIDPNAGRRTFVPLKEISPYLIAATIATEDKDFYTHPGFDPVAVVRALAQNYVAGGVVSGASTITQQLARNLLLSPAERVEQTYQRKAREIILAAELTRRYSKDEILELYLNENYYSNMAYGIEAASETYFKTSADKLTLSQATFLAGLPQAPGVYDIFSNRDETLQRHREVLTLMYQLSVERSCISISTTPQPVCLGAEEAVAAAEEIASYQFDLPQNQMVFPHWVNFVRTQLEAQFDSQTIYRSGFRVYTTLDPTMQREAERLVKEQVSGLADKNAQDGALVAIRPSTGEILVMVGSADFNNEAISGQVNMAISPRQPGSSIKPLTYLAAFEKGWTPATLIWDVKSEFPPSGDPEDTRDPYIPVNYDGNYHGPVSVRTALANSFNIPAVKALDFVGVYKDPKTNREDGLIAFAKRMGITTLTREDYGLSLTLGGGEVTLLEMTGAFATLANSGVQMSPYAITRIEDHLGNLVYEAPPQVPTQVVRAEHAYLISDILSDNSARSWMFGPNSVVNLPFPAAAKTGTTNDFRDNWTMGYSPDLSVGVWVGNADYTEMEHMTGLTGAAPIWAAFMQFAVPRLTNGEVHAFNRPAGIVDRVVCDVSGTEPSEYCRTQRTEIFAYDQLPPKKEDDLWKKVWLDTWTGLKASAACGDGFTKEELTINVTDKWARKWLQETDEGKAWLQSMGFEEDARFTPERECALTDPRPILALVGLNDGQTITTSPLDIYAVVNGGEEFRSFTLSYGYGDNPTSWKDLKTLRDQHTIPEKVFTWELGKVRAGTLVLRLVMEGSDNRYAEARVRLEMRVPTVTPTPTTTITTTPTATETPTLTETPMPSDTPMATDTPESTQTPTPNPTPIPTPTETLTP